jgi:hypothetical protein
MSDNFTRLIADPAFRTEFFDNLNRTISILQDHGYHDAVRGYCKARIRTESELKLYGIERDH